MYRCGVNGLRIALFGSTVGLIINPLRYVFVTFSVQECIYPPVAELLHSALSVVKNISGRVATRPYIVFVILFFLQPQEALGGQPSAPTFVSWSGEPL